MSVNEFEHTLDSNRLFQALPRVVLRRMLPGMELVDLSLEQILYEASEPIRWVYFPTTAIISMLYVLENDASAEIAIVGREGMMGIFLFMSAHNTPSRTVVQGAGQAYRVSAESFKAEFFRVGALFTLMMRYTQAVITQMTQTAVCNRHHTLDQQLCRWLLLSLDRVQTNHLVMTHKLISDMLGVRRVGVTVAAGKLQRAGLIEYRRGSIEVLDRKRLEALVCECYSVVRHEFAQLLDKGTR
mgnify:FL=1